MECNWLLLCLIGLLTVFGKVLKWISEPLAKLLVYAFSPEPKEMVSLKKEVAAIRLQLHSMNQMDNFADFSRTQRSLNKKESQLQGFEQHHKTILKTAITTGQWVSSLLILIGRVLIIATYRSVPVLILDPLTLWPLERVLSFPTGVPGGIGVPCWSMMCALALNFLTYSWKG